MTYIDEMEMIMTEKDNVEWTEAERKRLLFITLLLCLGMVLALAIGA